MKPLFTSVYCDCVDGYKLEIFSWEGNIWEGVVLPPSDSRADSIFDGFEYAQPISAVLVKNAPDGKLTINFVLSLISILGNTISKEEIEFCKRLSHHYLFLTRKKK